MIKTVARSRRSFVAATLAVGVLWGMAACGSVEDAKTTPKPAATAKPTSKPEAPKATPAATSKPEAPKATMTSGQKNAVAKAKSYLSYSSFSKQGLIEQLEFEGFSTADSTYAVGHVTVDWNAQAVAKAKSYLSYSSFSKQGLIDQLEFEGFTKAQAAYGAAQAY